MDVLRGRFDYCHACRRLVDVRRFRFDYRQACYSVRETRFDYTSKRVRGLSKSLLTGL